MIRKANSPEDLEKLGEIQSLVEQYSYVSADDSAP